MRPDGSASNHGAMAKETARAAMRAYYERGEERDRLAEPRGQLEFERTKEIVLRHLPPPPAVVADIGGGPGRYTLWLAALGYQVVHRDLMPMHVEQLRKASGANPLIGTGVADARELDLGDSSADAVLLLGPLYHLGRRADRLRALAEARRVARPGGPVFVAAISRWAPRMDGILRLRLDQEFPGVDGELAGIERTGHLPPFSPAGFSAYTHRPGQLRAELIASGSRVVDLVCVEGPAYLLDDLPERLADDEARRVVLETARALERVPELLGIGPHLLATVR
jgi:SAM-dependent methyltransferase